MASLGKDEIVTIHVLKKKGASNSGIARQLKVSEGTVRYHLKRQGKGDGRAKKSLIEELGLPKIVASWWHGQTESLPKDRAPNIRALWDFLVAEHEYTGSIKSLRKYIRKHFPKPKLRAFRRIETPPGAQVQSDWFEVKVDIGEGPETLNGFVMLLSHSRKTAVIFSKSMDQLNWHRVHNEAFKRLGGIAAVNRIDNLKTGVASGSGTWGQINTSYQAYAQMMGFHVDPHEAYAPNQKGKVERRVAAIKALNLSGLCFGSLEELQMYVDKKLEQQSQRLRCPATGKSVASSWEEERKLLRPLPRFMPEPFDLIRDCQVNKDCTIRFDGKTYAVPFRFVGQQVEVRRCAQVIQIVDKTSGTIAKEYNRFTEALLLIDADCYEGDSTDTVKRPKPLGKVSQKLQELMQEEPEIRSIGIYERLAEVCR